MSSCTYIANGTQCAFPGTFSHGTLGDGRWLCALHNAAGSDHAEGVAIVARSGRWSTLKNPAEAWVEMRRKQVYCSESPAVRKLREQMAAHRSGHPVGIASSRLAQSRKPGEDEHEAA